LAEDTTASILSDVELTTNTITTEIPELPATTTGNRSRDLAEDTTASILSDVELTTNSNTTEISAAAAEAAAAAGTTTTTTLAAHDPIVHALRQGTLASTANGLESSNSTPECTQSCSVPVTSPDTPIALEAAPTAAEGTATSAASVADVVTGAPRSASDATSRGVSRNNSSASRTPAGSLRPRPWQQTRGMRCVLTGCFPSMSSSIDYYCCRRVGSRYLYYKGTCPVDQGFIPLFSSCGFKVRPVLPYLNQQNGRSRTNSLNDAVIWRITTQQPRPFPISLPTYLLTGKRA